MRISTNGVIVNITIDIEAACCSCARGDGAQQENSVSEREPMAQIVVPANDVMPQPTQHTTELLRALEAARQRFWGALYDPSDKTTAPTNHQVSSWLREKGVSEHVAKVMAKILRADGLPTGRRI